MPRKTIRATLLSHTRLPRSREQSLFGSTQRYRVDGDPSGNCVVASNYRGRVLLIDQELRIVADFTIPDRRESALTARGDLGVVAYMGVRRMGLHELSGSALWSAEKDNPRGHAMALTKRSPYAWLAMPEPLGFRLLRFDVIKRFLVGSGHLDTDAEIVELYPFPEGDDAVCVTSLGQGEATRVIMVTAGNGEFSYRPLSFGVAPAALDERWIVNCEGAQIGVLRRDGASLVGSLKGSELVVKEPEYPPLLLDVGLGVLGERGALHVWSMPDLREHSVVQWSDRSLGPARAVHYAANERLFTTHDGDQLAIWQLTATEQADRG